MFDFVLQISVRMQMSIQCINSVQLFVIYMPNQQVQENFD
jgi:hypothetical protein